MQNDFERQVQQKLEELNLVPSEPVWLNIEKQIHNKKDRRMIFLWLPLLFMLLGAGVWWLNYDGNNRQDTSHNTMRHPVQVPATIIQTPAKNDNEISSEKNGINKKEDDLKNYSEKQDK